MNVMRLVGPVLGRLRVGRFRDWYRFTWLKLRQPGTIQAAGLPQLDPGVRIRTLPGSRLVLGRGVHLASGVSLQLTEGTSLEIGDRVFLNVNCTIGAIGRVRIGDDCLFGPGVTIVDGNHRFDDLSTLIRDQGHEIRDIEIGSDVWVGASATIIASVGDGAVVGANSVVTRPVPARTVVAGTPARVLRQRGERAQVRAMRA